MTDVEIQLEESEWEQTAHKLDKLSLNLAFARLQKAEKKNQLKARLW